MLGNKLLQVLKDLNTSERKLLIYRAKRSEDKRLKQFIRLLGEPNQSSAEFQESLMIVKNNISSKGQTEKIKNDQLRRFIDFCIKEIEDLKIENYSKSHPAIRNYILSDVYNKSNTRYIYQDYLLKLNFSTKNSKFKRDLYFYFDGIILNNDIPKKNILNKIVLYLKSLYIFRIFIKK